MALGYTLVDFDELEKAVKQLETAKTSLDDKLKSIKGIVDSSVNNAEIYLSSDARVTREQFEQMYNKWAPKFTAYVQEYIDYFNKTKIMYQERAEKEKDDAGKLNTFID